MSWIQFPRRGATATREDFLSESRRLQVVIGVMLVTLVSGCAMREKVTYTPHRALPSPTVEVLSLNGPLPTRLTWKGEVTRHSSDMGANLERTLQISVAGVEEPQTLRYQLPNSLRLPINKGDTVTVEVYGKQGDAASPRALGIAVYNEQGAPLAFVDETGGLPAEIYKKTLGLRPETNVIYLESKPVDGICAVVLEHRAVVFQGTGNNEIRLEPGASGTIQTKIGAFQITLLDHAVVIDTECTHRDLNRLSFVGMRLSPEEMPTEETSP